MTPIDVSTILNDLDGTLTGVTVVQPDCTTPVRSRTSSVSVNDFFNAPTQIPACAAFGVQTSAYDFVTTVVAKLRPSELPSPQPQWVIDPDTWTNKGAEPFPAVPIYRQLVLADDLAPCDSVCDGPQLGCQRAALMAGTQNGQAPYLTINNGVYYIDTATQDLSCIHAGGWQTPGFQGGQAYLIWNLFAAKDTKLTYQIYVGAHFNPATDGRWVRVQPHVRLLAAGTTSLWKSVPIAVRCRQLPCTTAS